MRPGAERDGLALRAPVYRAGMGLDSVEQRRAALLGIVSVVLRIQPLFAQRSGGDDAQPMRLQVRDLGLSDGQALLYDSAREQEGSPGPTAAAAYETEVELHGRRWAMHAAENRSHRRHSARGVDPAAARRPIKSAD